MRGRTNAESGNGVILNGTIDTYEVAPNETVLAGDFIERYTIINGGISASTNPIFLLSDGKYLIGTELFIDNGDHTFSRWGSSGISVTPQFQIATNEFISLENYSEKYMRVHFISYDATNEYCVTRHVDYGFDVNWGVRKGDLYSIQESNKTFTIFHTHTSSNNQGRYGILYRIWILTVSGNNYNDYTYSVSSFYQEGATESSSEPTPRYFAFAMKIQTNEYIYQTVTQSSKTAIQNVANIIRVNKVGSSNNRVTVSSISGTALKPIGTITDGGNVGFLFINNGKLYGRYVYFDLSNINNYTIYDSFEIASLADYDYSKGYGGFFPLRVDDDSIDYDRYIILANYSDISGAFELYISKTDRDIQIGEFTSFSSSSQAFIYLRNNGDYLMTAFSNLLEVEIDNHVVKAQLDTHKYARSIHTQDYIMGVAKQSGNAGDTIEVYIPQVNS